MLKYSNIHYSNLYY